MLRCLYEMRVRAKEKRGGEKEREEGKVGGKWWETEELFVNATRGPRNQ